MFGQALRLGRAAPRVRALRSAIRVPVQLHASRLLCTVPTPVANHQAKGEDSSSHNAELAVESTSALNETVHYGDDGAGAAISKDDYEDDAFLAAAQDDADAEGTFDGTIVREDMADLATEEAQDSADFDSASEQAHKDLATGEERAVAAADEYEEVDGYEEAEEYEYAGEEYELDYDDEGLGSISPEEELRMLQELSLDELRTFSREMELSDQGDKEQLIAALQAVMAEERLAAAEEGEEELGMEPLPAQGGERGGGQSEGETRPSLYTRVVYSPAVLVDGSEQPGVVGQRALPGHALEAEEEHLLLDELVARAQALADRGERSAQMVADHAPQPPRPARVVQVGLRLLQPLEHELLEPRRRRGVALRLARHGVEHARRDRIGGADRLRACRLDRPSVPRRA